MKNTILIVLLHFFMSPYAQINEWLNMYPNDGESPERIDHISFNVHYDGWFHNLKNIKTKWYSIGFDVNIYKDFPLNKSGSFSLAVGLGYSLNNVHHNGIIYSLFDSTLNKETTNIIPLAVSVWKNKTTTQFLELPIEFRFSEKKDIRFRLYTGFKFGFLIGSHNTFSDTNRKKSKEYKLTNIMPYRYGPTLKLGYGKLTLYGFYSISNMFNENGPLINPFSIGLSFFFL